MVEDIVIDIFICGVHRYHDIHPKTKTPLLFKAPIFNDMLEYMQQNFNKDYVDVLLDKDPHTFLSL